MFLVACYFRLSAKAEQIKLFEDYTLAIDYAKRRRKYLNSNWCVTVNKVNLDFMEII